MAKKKIVKEHLERLDLWSDFEGPISRVEEFLHQKAKAWEESGFSNIRMECDGPYGSLGLSLYGERLETDKEMVKRLQKGKRERVKKAERKKKTLERDLTEYRRLHKQFDGYAPGDVFLK